MKRQGFDTKKYLKSQTQTILDRIKKFDNRLYLEFGGKLCYDSHAARVLPGYEADAKIQLFLQLKKDLKIFYCISAKDLQKGKITSVGAWLTYDLQTLKDVNELIEKGIDVGGVVINRFEGEEAAKRFKRQLENLGINVYVQNEMKNYPQNIDFIVSENGFGSQKYIEMDKSLIIVTGAGGGSGKMNFCLCQIYHDNKIGVNSGFAKFETFPIWNLPLNHPVNVAYEASTADLKDENMVDPFHLKSYNVEAINYNRDVENFTIMKKIFEKIVRKENFVNEYKSPTDMGVNKAKDGIIDDEIVQEAAKQEIIRRYFQYKKDFMKGIITKDVVERSEELMKKVCVSVENRKVVLPAREAAIEAERKGKGHKGIFCGAAIELMDGRIVTGKNSPLLHSESACVLNAIKVLANIPDENFLLSSHTLENIAKLKKEVLDAKSESLNVEETLTALATSTATNPLAERGIKELKELKDCEMHVTHVLSSGDESGLRKLGLNVTTDSIPIIRYVR